MSKKQGGVQLNGSASTYLSKITEEQIKEIIRVEMVLNNHKNGIKVYKRLPKWMKKLGIGKSMEPDGFIWTLNNILNTVFEVKTQGNEGNALERWWENYNIAESLSGGNFSYITFCAGEGFKEGNGSYIKALTMMEIEARKEFGMPMVNFKEQCNETYRYKQFNIFYEKGQSWYIVDNMSEEKIKEIVKKHILNIINEDK